MADPENPTSSPSASSDPTDVAQRGVFLSFRKVSPQWWRAELRINATDSGLSGFRCGGEGDDVGTAIARAAHLTRAALNDPLIQSIAPPGTLLALTAIHDVAKAAHAGKLTELVEKFSTPMLRSVSSAISDATHGLLGGLEPLCMVCADGSTPNVRERRHRAPDLRDTKRFPEGTPPGVPFDAAYLYPPTDPAAVAGFRRNGGKRR